MEKVQLIHTILKSTNSGSYAALTKEFLLHFGFTMTSDMIATYNKEHVKLYIHFNPKGAVEALFTEKSFKYKDSTVDYDWYQPKTIKEFLDIFNEYKKYIQHNSQFNKNRKSWILRYRNRN